MLKRGVFISLEGIEGCGKSTQAKILYEYLSQIGKCVILTREPGGTFIAEKIRDLLLDPQNSNMSEMAELFLYLASRSLHVNQVIKPALNDGKIVICERFNDATYAYQGFARGLDLKLLMSLAKIATNGLEPDITILLDLDIEEGLSRAEKLKNHLDRLESESIEFHNKVRKGYIKLAEDNPERIKIINARGTVEEVSLFIRKYIDSMLLSD